MTFIKRTAAVLLMLSSIALFGIGVWSIFGLSYLHSIGFLLLSNFMYFLAKKVAETIPTPK